MVPQCRWEKYAAEAEFAPTLQQWHVQFRTSREVRCHGGNTVYLSLRLAIVAGRTWVVLFLLQTLTAGFTHRAWLILSGMAAPGVAVDLEGHL